MENIIFQDKARERSLNKRINSIELKDVSHNYGPTQALRNISLRIQDGDVLFVTGKSGAGKTSLLNILAGEITPTRGDVKKQIWGDYFSAQVFQDLKLLHEHTCEENLWLSFDETIYKNKNIFYNDLLELSQVLGIKDKLTHRVMETNGGTKQKVAILRALLSKPNLFIADEPTSSLDKENASKVFEVLNYFNMKKNMAIVWASHNRELIKEFPGKILHLDNGKLIYSGHACFI